MRTSNALFAIVLAQIILFSSAKADDDPDDKDGFPSIWSALGNNKQYHIMFQLQLLNSSERLTIEEWVSFETYQHRLDLVSDQGRTTYLTNANTGEIFMYRPYSCKLLKDDASELKTISTLFAGYPLGNKTDVKPSLVYGLGSLWLYAKAHTKIVEKHSLVDTKSYDIYDVDLKDVNKDYFDYKLRFFFEKGFKFVDSIEWSLEVREIIQARAKVIQMPHDEPIQQEIFDLPVGYGCVRNQKYDHSFQVNRGRKFLHDEAPNKAIIEVSLSYPKDSSHHSWQTNRYSLSIMRGIMKLNELTRSYYVSSVQFRNPLSGQLVRQRKVWSNSSNSQATAILYTMDPDTGDCKVNHVLSGHRMNLDLPGQQDKSSLSRPAPIRVTLDLLDWLFNNWDNFHLIDEKPSVLSLIAKEATYELRLDQLQFQEKGPIIWFGPISIVKEVSLMGQYITFPFDINDVKLFESYHTKVTIFFYSDDRTKVEYKISFQLFENTNIDVNHMQRQLDISSCIPDERSKEIVIKYPIEQEEARSGLVAMQDVILETFCLNLLSTTPIDPLSVNNFEITLDQFSMYIKFNLLNLPLWQSYQKKVGFSLAKGATLYEKASGSLESCSESCEHHNCLRFAFSAAHRKCQLEIGSEQSLTVNNAAIDFALFEAPKIVMHSPWIELDPNGGKKHLRPLELLEILRQFILYSGDENNEGASKDGDINIPLTIKIEQQPGENDKNNNKKPLEYINLKPISIESSFEDMNEIMRISGENKTSDELVFVSDTSKLKAEYSIFLEDRVFEKFAKFAEEFGVMSYEECAANCDDLNCRSFSYCETSKKCIVSKLHDSASIEASTKQAFTCTISVLDYLTKFESFGSAALPIRAKKEIPSRSEQDCAHSCIEDQTIDCQAFYFCSSRCYLEDKHIHDINPAGLESIVAYQIATGDLNHWEKLDTMNPQTRPCNFYSRSYLAQFDQYTGKSLDNLDPTRSQQLEVESDMGPDSCARACIGRSCVAFDVCLEQKEDTGSKQICRLSRSSIRKGDLLSNRKGCSTFVLSDKSQFNLANTTIVKLNQQPDYKALDRRPAGKEIIVDPDQKEAEDGDIMRGLMQILSGSASVGKDKSIIGGSHWFSRLLSILFGIFLGIVCAVLWLKRSEIQVIRERFEWRRLMAIFGR